MPSILDAIVLAFLAVIGIAVLITLAEIFRIYYQRRRHSAEKKHEIENEDKTNFEQHINNVNSLVNPLTSRVNGTELRAAAAQENGHQRSEFPLFQWDFITDTHTQTETESKIGGMPSKSASSSHKVSGAGDSNSRESQQQQNRDRDRDRDRDRVVLFNVEEEYKQQYYQE